MRTHLHTALLVVRMMREGSEDPVALVSHTMSTDERDFILVTDHQPLTAIFHAEKSLYSKYDSSTCITLCHLGSDVQPTNVVHN